MKTIKKVLVRISLIIIVSLMITSCGSTKTADGAISGAVIGGLVGGWDGAATGALVGGGVGLMADSADDKKVRQDQKERELRMMERANSQSNPQPQTESKPKCTNVLNGSVWKVVSMVDETKGENDFASWIISFQSDKKATTIVMDKDGNSETFSESYNIIDDVIIFTGKDYVTNAKFVVTDSQMIIVTDTARVVLKEV